MTLQKHLLVARHLALATTVGVSGLVSCSEASDGAQSGDVTGLTFRSDVLPVTRVEDAKASVFIPPYLDCRAPKPGEVGTGPEGKVCTHVSIAGCTEPGKYYPDYASCDVVRTQRPFWQVPPAKEPPASDPRLSDPAYLGEAAWVKQQVEACACTCCHDSRSFGGKAGEWDIGRGPLWMDTLSDTGLALFAGLADSSVLGAYPPADNHGFDRTQTGIPTNDTARMQAFTRAELARRGLSEAQARAVPPFGGPIYANRIAQPTTCEAGEGIAVDGRIYWKSGVARYVYVLGVPSENPGVPPNLDLPTGTIFRLDVLPSADALSPGVVYGTTPPGTFQYEPDRRRAPALTVGTTYHLYALRDVGIPVMNCLFRYGDPVVPQTLPGTGGATGAGGQPATSGGAASTGGVPAGSGGATSTGGAPAGSGGAVSASGGAPSACTLPGGDAEGFGATCTDGTNSTDCTCGANYCAVQPGATSGFCSKTGCKENPALCPTGFSCFDLSVFGAGLPSFCNRD